MPTDTAHLLTLADAYAAARSAADAAYHDLAEPAWLAAEAAAASARGALAAALDGARR